MNKGIFIVVFLLLALGALAWFKPGGPAYFGFRIINNTFEASPTDTFDDNYDYGDTDPAIIANYGKGVSANNAFRCGYPISIVVWLSAEDTGPHGAYESARLEYFQGTQAPANDTNWVLIKELTVNQLKAVQGKKSAAFGLVTWTPPDVNNTRYLLRIHAKTFGSETNFPSESSDLTTPNVITGNGDGATWQDWAVLDILVIPNRRPGY